MPSKPTDAPSANAPTIAINEKGLIETEIDGKPLRSHYTFYRGEHTNFLPLLSSMSSPGALAKYVLSGWMPKEPIIGKDTQIIAFGSCFAGYIARYLENMGFNVATRKDKRAYVSAMGDGIVNTFAIRQQFEWAWLNRVPEVELWHDFKAREFGYNEAVRAVTRDMFNEAGVFIITLGLSEIWYDEPTGEVFWRAVPFAKFDPSRHKFRVASSSENLQNLMAIREIIRRFRPDAAIIFTLSPIPLTATFRGVSPITANAASKSNLRSALDELMTRFSSDERLFYFPSYEVVLNCFRNIFTHDFRHPHLHILNLNMKAFERYFCDTGMTDEELDAIYLDALEKDRELGRNPGQESSEQQTAAAEQWLANNPVNNLQQAVHETIRSRHAAKGSNVKPTPDPRAD
jgi:GSCFA family